MEARLESAASICALMPRPQVVQGLLVSWIRNHFSAAPNIEDPALQNSLWAADISKTGIVIDSVYRWQPAATEFRPGIFIKRNAWRLLHLGIDDRKMGGIPLSGNQQYAAYIQGAHSLFCIASAPAECEILGAEVYRELLEFSPVIRQAFGFMRFQVMEVGEVSILEEARQNFVLPISVAYAAEHTWEITKQAPPLKAIQLSTFLP
jgi:hypothetical protein